MFNRLRTYRITLVYALLLEDLHMSDVLPRCKIDRTSPDFPKVERFALKRLKEIVEMPGRGIWSKLKRRMHFSSLSNQLALYGWQIKWDGSFYEVPVFEEPCNPKPNEHTKPKPLSSEYYSNLARNHFVETGKLINPHTGQPISNAERYRYFS